MRQRYALRHIIIHIRAKATDSRRCLFRHFVSPCADLYLVMAMVRFVCLSIFMVTLPLCVSFCSHFPSAITVSFFVVVLCVSVYLCSYLIDFLHILIFFQSRQTDALSQGPSDPLIPGPVPVQ